MQAKKLTLWAGAALLGLSSFSAQAALIDIFDYGFNIDGISSVPTLGDPIPAEVDTSGFSTITGLGNIDVTITGAGAHNVDAFFDHEIDEAINTFFNESGTATGTSAAGQSWEIDEPGFLFGDIFDNFELSTLDNSNGVPVGLEDDVSLAMGWDFSLATGETAAISFTLADMLPPITPGFFLTHTDANSVANIYLWSSLTINYVPPDPDPIPEPSIVTLFGLGLFGIGFVRRRKA